MKSCDFCTSLVIRCICFYYTFNHIYLLLILLKKVFWRFPTQVCENAHKNSYNEAQPLKRPPDELQLIWTEQADRLMEAEPSWCWADPDMS